jgi:hypothetical protein
MFFVFLGGTLACLLADFCIWLLWIRPYVQHQGEKNVPVVVILAFSGSSLLDYKTACQLAKEHGRKPWFLRLFERLFWTAMSFWILCLTVLFIGKLRGE